jgi:hypothetical protein
MTYAGRRRRRRQGLRRAPQIAALIVLCLVMQFRVGTCHRHSRRKIRFVGGSTILRGGDSRASVTATTTKRPLESIHSREPCRFFIWDAMSAIRYHMCHSELKKYIYEGKGGKKYVRLLPDSVLEKLYPCTQYATDRCSICQFSFRDHLVSWWKPRLGSDLDLHLDSVQSQAITHIPPYKVEWGGRGIGWVWTQTQASTKKYGLAELKKYAFHRLCVQEVSPKQLSQDQIGKEFFIWNDYNETDMTHLLPWDRPVPFQTRSPDSGTMNTLTWVAKFLLIGQIDTFMTLQRKENNRFIQEQIFVEGKR